METKQCQAPFCKLEIFDYLPLCASCWRTKKMISRQKDEDDDE